jgi:hypothetical protein
MRLFVFRIKIGHDLFKPFKAMFTIVFTQNGYVAISKDGFVLAIGNDYFEVVKKAQEALNIL